MIDLDSITVGTDAEVPVFLVTGLPIPCTGLVGGTKDEPRPLGKLGPGYFIQEDNVNLEFNVPPSKTASLFEKTIVRALQQISHELPPSMTYKIESATEYDVNFLNNPRVLTFGCDPDYCVYTGEENPKPRCSNPGLRTAAAHIHIGWDGPTNEDRRNMIRMMDLTAGLSFIRAENPKRKQLYGKAGAYRPKKYGVEYRTPGNAWLHRSQHMFGSVKLAARLVNVGTQLTPAQEALLINTINTCELTNDAIHLATKFGVTIH